MDIKFFKMKVVISLLLFCFFEAILSSPIEKEKAVEECISELNLNTDVKEHFKTYGEVPDENDKNMKCFFHCVSKKIGMTDENGTINTAQVMDYVLSKHTELTRDQVDPVMTLCANRSESDPCEKWYEFMKCQVKAYLDHKAKVESS